MDKKKQPGIVCNSMILVESIFKRKPKIADDLEIALNFDVKNTFSGDNKNLITEVTAIINTVEDTIYAKVTYIGIFSIPKKENMDLKQFSETSAPAILFPYIREEIHSKMQKASLPKSVIIPPLNITALINENN